MSEISDKFSRMEDGTAKSAIAMNLFGRSGANLIPTINELNATVATTNATISTDFANAAATFDDELAKMKHGIQGVVGSGKAGTFILETMTGALKILESVVIEGTFRFSSWGTTIVHYAKAAKDGITGNFSAARNEIAKLNADLAQMEKDRIAGYQKLWGPKGKDKEKPKKDFTPGSASDLSTSSTASKLKAQLEQVQSSLQSEEEAIQASYIRRKQIIDNALHDHLITASKASALLVKLEADKTNKLSSVKKKGILEQLGLTKVQALKEGLIHAKSAVIGAYKWGAGIGGPVLGGIAAAAAGAFEYKQLSDLGGGGSVNTGSTSLPAPESSQADTSTSQSTSTHNQNVTVNINGETLDPSRFNHDDIRKLVEVIDNAQHMGVA